MTSQQHIMQQPIPPTADLIKNRMHDLDFGKQELARAADVHTLKKFARKWKVEQGLNGPLFVIAHELWQPAHIRLFSQLLAKKPHLATSRKWVHTVLCRLQDVAPDVRNNGLQTGLIKITHGIGPLMNKYKWTSSRDTWKKLRKFARLLRRLPSRHSAADFKQTTKEMQKLKLPSVTSQKAYGFGHLCRSYMHSVGKPFPSAMLSGLKTLQQCEYDSLVAEACGKPGAKKQPRHITETQLLAFLMKMTPAEVEQAALDRTPMSRRDRERRLRYVGARDLFMHMRKHCRK
jgi:hypothetical protein